MTSEPASSVPALTRRGVMLVLSSPSGAGKSSISQALLEREPQLVLSVSATTRPPRLGEVDGVHYHFVTPEKFAGMVAANEFLEYAHVFGNSYGTPKSFVEAALSAGKDVLFDIDWQGTQQLAQNAGPDLVSVFVLPPSLPELERRLRGRAQDSEEVVNRRMAKASDEMSHWPEYHFVLVNSDLEESIHHVQAVLTAERIRRVRQIGLAQFVNAMRV